MCFVNDIIFNELVLINALERKCLPKWIIFKNTGNYFPKLCFNGKDDIGLFMESEYGCRQCCFATEGWLIVKENTLHTMNGGECRKGAAVFVEPYRSEAYLLYTLTGDEERG